MKPSRSESEALKRRPVSPEHQRYEQEKARWVFEHPHATAQEYERAMSEIARRCGI